MTEQLIEFTPGQKPAGIDDHDLIQWKIPGHTDWSQPNKAGFMGWSIGKQYRLFSPLRNLPDHLESDK